MDKYSIEKVCAGQSLRSCSRDHYKLTVDVQDIAQYIKKEVSHSQSLPLGLNTPWLPMDNFAHLNSLTRELVRHGTV